MADGYLNFDTRIDTSGFQAGLAKISAVSNKGAEALKKLLSSAKNVGESGAKALGKIVETGEKIGKLTWTAFDKSIKATTASVTALSAGMGAFFTSSIQSGQKFEASMSQVIATMGVTKDTMTDIDGVETNVYDMLADKAKEMGAKTKFSASEAADALNYLALAGYDAEKACNALPIVLDLAAAGGMDLAYASDLATDAMSALNMEATTENLTNFGDSMAKTASRANTNVAQLGEAILVCGGQATLANMDLTEMNTALGILADNGIKGSEGGTALRNVLKNLYTPTQDASKAFAELGIQTSNIDTGELLPVQDVLQQIGSALDGLNSDSLKMQYMGRIFDTRTIAAGNALLNNSVERWNELSAEVADCDGAMAQMAETMNDNLTGQVTIFKSALEGVQNLVYEKIENPLKTAVKNGTKYLDELNQALNSGGFEGLGKIFGDVLAEAIQDNSGILNQAVKAGQNVTKYIIEGISQNSEKISEQIVENLSIGVSAFSDGFTGFYELGFSLVAKIAEGISDNPDFITDLVTDFVTKISKTFSKYSAQLIKSGTAIAKAVLKGFLNSAQNVSKDISTFIGEMFKLFIDEFPEIFDIGVDIFTALVSGIRDGISETGLTAKEIIDTIAKSISDNSEILLSTSWEILSAIGKGIAENLPALSQYAVNVVVSLAQFLAEHSAEIGSGAVALILSLADTLLSEENLTRLLESAIAIISQLIAGMTNPEVMEQLAEVAHNIVNAVADTLLGGETGGLNDLFSAGAYIAGQLLSGLATALFDTDNGIFAILNDLVTSVGEYLSENFWKFGTMVIEGFISGMSGIEFSFEDYREYLFNAKQDGTLWSDYFENAKTMWSDVFGKGLGFEVVAENNVPQEVNALQALDGYENIEQLNADLVESVRAEQQSQQQSLAVLPYFSPQVQTNQATPYKPQNTTIQMYLYPDSTAFDEVVIDAQNRNFARNGGFLND